MNPKISVIVPVYNTKRYLHECVDSILVQTFTDFELLLIDDGSTDSSEAICDEYAATDPRVRVFHKTNGGVSSARNLGLDNARGEWIAFVDADDIIPKNSLKKRFEENSKDDIDLGIFQHESFGYENAKYGPYCEKIYCNLELFQADYLSFISLLGPLWNKMYRNNIIATLRFNEKMSFGEDYLFNIVYISNCKRFKLHNEIVYKYRIYSSMSLSKCFTINRLYDIDNYSNMALNLFSKEMARNTILFNYVSETHISVVQYFINDSIPKISKVENIMRWYSNSILTKLPLCKYNGTWKHYCLRVFLRFSIIKFALEVLSLWRLMKELLNFRCRMSSF